MREHTYRTRVRRTRRGQWRVTVPDLPGRPSVTVRSLANAPSLLIEQVAKHLGVPAAQVEVDVQHPVKARRRVTASTVQLFSAVPVLSGVYLAGGAAATLITGGVVMAALAVLRESGRI